MSDQSNQIHTDKAPEANQIEYLLTTTAIRERCAQLLSLARKGSLPHFHLHEDKLPALAKLLKEEITIRYAGQPIPYHSRWRHFSAGGRDRSSVIDKALKDESHRNRCMAKLELAIISVLLDAGAGNAWRYIEAQTGETYSRSEGLAVASLDGFLVGSFGATPHTGSGERLASLTIAELEALFQISADNPLAGIQGRVELMNALGKSTLKIAEETNAHDTRLGNILYCIEAQTHQNTIQADTLLQIILTQFGEIWPGRLIVNDLPLGDVWRHPLITGEGITDQLVPFHKLSQWLTYSLLEPLEEYGIIVLNLNRLTGLAEYRNGGLFIDSGVLELRDPNSLDQFHLPDAQIIVEWRALTIALLDCLAEYTRGEMNLTAEEVPLAKILEGGTWSLGRKLALQRRKDGSPPLQIQSDGTVF